MSTFAKIPCSLFVRSYTNRRHETPTSSDRLDTSCTLYSILTTKQKEGANSVAKPGNHYIPSRNQIRTTEIDIDREFRGLASKKSVSSTLDKTISPGTRSMLFKCIVQGGWNVNNAVEAKKKPCNSRPARSLEAADMGLVLHESRRLVQASGNRALVRVGRMPDPFVGKRHRRGSDEGDSHSARKTKKAKVDHKM